VVAGKSKRANQTGQGEIGAFCQSSLSLVQFSQPVLSCFRRLWDRCFRKNYPLPLVMWYRFDLFFRFPSRIHETRRVGAPPGRRRRASWPATPLRRVQAPPAQATAGECELRWRKPPSPCDRLVSTWPSPHSGGPVLWLRGRPPASARAHGLCPSGERWEETEERRRWEKEAARRCEKIR